MAGNIYDALRYMLQQDGDMASVENKVGFNKTDTLFAHSLGKQLRSRGALTKKQVVALRRMLRKYVKNQLGSKFALAADVPMLKPVGKSAKAGTEATVVKRVYAGKGMHYKKAILLRSPYDAKLLAAIKTIRGGRWNATDKIWEVPYNVDGYQATRVALLGRGFEFEQGLKDKFGVALKKREAMQELSGAAIDDSELKIDGLDGQGRELKPFQRACVRFCIQAGGRVLIADEMGLGKTVEALAYLQYVGYNAACKVIITVPATLKYNWAKEAKIWLSGDWSITIIADGKTPLPTQGIIIISYAQAAKRKDELLAWKPDFVILDECHYIKNAKRNRSKAVCGHNVQNIYKKGWLHIPGYAEDAKHILALSGTPILNRPTEIYTTLKLLDSKAWGKSWFKFAKRYTNATHNGFGWDFKGVRNTEELRNRLATIMIRRTKSQVLPELEPKQYAIVNVEISNRGTYDRAEDDIIRWLSETEGVAAAAKATRAEFLVKLNKLRTLMGLGKVKAAVAWAQDFLDGTDQKLIVFAHHKDVVDRLYVELRSYGCVKVVGGMSSNLKDQSVVNFQENDDVRVIIVSTAGGLGLTLTAASNMLFTERLWNPPQEWQVEDRIHRMGQEDRVTIWKLAAQDTLDEYFAELVAEKREVFGSMFELGGDEEVLDNVYGDLSNWLKQRS